MKQSEFRFRNVEFKVEHLGKNLTFVLPPTMPGTYSQSQKDLDNQGLRAPTFSEIVSLVYAVSKTKPERLFREFGLKELNYAYAQESLWSNSGVGLWGFTGLIYMPEGNGTYESGIIIQDNPKIVNGRASMELSELIHKLEAKDPTVRFTKYAANPWDPYHCCITEVERKENCEARKPENLVKNEILITLLGQEGVKKLAEIASRHEDKPRFETIGILNKKPKKPLVGFVSLREEETEHNYNDPWYTSNIDLNCVNEDSEKYLKHAVGIKEK